jgi:hypothetical protein
LRADRVSGVTTALAEREQGRRLFDMLRAGDTLVVRWVDRFGRNYKDVTDNIREFIAHAKAGEEDACRGRKPRFSRERFEIVRDMLAQETPVTTIATMAHSPQDQSIFANAQYIAPKDKAHRSKPN